MAGERGTALARALIPFARRLRLSLVARVLPAAVAAALGAASVLLLVARPDPAYALSAYAAALGLAGLASWWYARWRIPSLAATARQLDARFGLEDRIVTALQFAEPTDDVARVVVADALSRLEHTAVTRIPVAAGGPGLWAAAATVMVTGVVVAGPLGRETPSRIDRGGFALASEPLTLGRHGDVPTGEAPSQGQRAAVRMAAGSPAPVTAERRGVPAGARAPVTASAGAIAAQPAAPGAGGGSATRNDPGAEAIGEGASGRGASAGGAARRAAGGVRHGSTAASGAPGGASGGARLDAETYRQALARTETAIGRDRVPVSLRAYVRDYLLAIRPREEP
jgi:hypothetical protein